MKKKSLKKLKINKASISALDATNVKGGFGDSVYICDSVQLCETIHVTRCYGNYNCGLFDANTIEC
ncbi:hypothetical protein [Kordia zhangzhouensis]|uniref:hypothetical protein n=1 Tax=Kordia zhangzhouensis TaxID=1620405 RepID=UPI000628FE8B|nr:hypothetical protein [Kordia zhangzhouensis]